VQLIRIALALAVAAGTAYAFPTGSQFDLDPVMYDGAGGIAFDGAPRWTSHTCAVCHTNAPGLISIRLEADHPELFTTGYTAAMQYHLRVVMDGEHEGLPYAKFGDNYGFTTDPYQPCDENGFAVELDDINGTPRGTFAVVVDNACAPGSTSTDVDAYILKDGTAAMHSGAHDAQVAWDVCWTAPPAGTGTVTAFVAAVDGNGGDGTINFPNDTIGDDVAAGQVPIAEAGATAVQTQGGGCNAGGDAGAIIAVAVAWLARRRRKVAALTLVVAMTGCAHVRPRQREILAKRAMKFSPDPAEDELDLHMQESREGSEGGYGSSGGGCGCN
jgi:uncharacterized protein (TIGR03382 family)